MQNSPGVSAVVSANVWIAQSTFLHGFKEGRGGQWSGGHKIHKFGKRMKNIKGFQLKSSSGGTPGCS